MSLLNFMASTQRCSPSFFLTAVWAFSHKGSALSNLVLPALRQLKPPLPPVASLAPRDPSLPLHDCQRASQGGAVHAQEVSHLSLRDLARERERLQYGELRGPQSCGTQRLLVNLGKRPGCPPQIGTQTRQIGYRHRLHKQIRCIYIYSRCSRIRHSGRKARIRRRIDLGGCRVTAQIEARAPDVNFRCATLLRAVRMIGNHAG